MILLNVWNNFFIVIGIYKKLLFGCCVGLWVSVGLCVYIYVYKFKKVKLFLIYENNVIYYLKMGIYICVWFI